MKKIFIVISLCIFISTSKADNINTEKILNNIDDLYRSNASHGIITLSVITINWQRTLTLEQWSKGEDKSLIKILKPKKEKGLATLRVDKNVWNYMPKVKRVVKIPSSMMSSSWMGSHFTNDDLVKQSRMTEDYTFSITFEGIKDSKEIIVITCLPNKEAAVVWGMVEVVVYTSDYIPLRMIYYDEDLLLSRTLEFTNIQKMGGKMIPILMSMIPADEPGETTTVKWNEIQFDVAIDDEFFSLHKLQH
jgi:outer membrane lipoprotein-sorting protein